MTGCMYFNIFRMLNVALVNKDQEKMSLMSKWFFSANIIKGKWLQADQIKSDHTFIRYIDTNPQRSL